MRAFLKKHPVAYPIAIVDTYRPPADFDTPRGLPMTYLIGPDGKIVDRFLGPVTAHDIESAIAKAGGPASARCKPASWHAMSAARFIVSGQRAGRVVPRLGARAGGLALGLRGYASATWPTAASKCWRPATPPRSIAGCVVAAGAAARGGRRPRTAGRA